MNLPRTCDPFKRILIFGLILFLLGSGFTQDYLEYQKPPKAILELADAPLPPSLEMDSKGENVVLFFQDTYMSIAEMSEKEMRLGGLRINPRTNINSRIKYQCDLNVMRTATRKIRKVTGMPTDPRLANFSWSPNQKMIAFSHTTFNGVELWVLNIEKASVKKLTEAKVNANLPRPFVWFKDNSGLLVKMLPDDRKSLINTTEVVPTGPTVTFSTGEKAQNRTYQDLLQNPNDEYNFEQLTRSEIIHVELTGSSKKWLPAAMYDRISMSPSGEYVMVSAIQKPFSYIVPYRRFPMITHIYDHTGKFIKKILEVPLNEVLPKGFMAVREGKRNLQWRSDQPATVVWIEALDGGDPANEAEYRDEVFQLPAPFSGEAKSMLKTVNRFSRIDWGNDQTAAAHDRWWKNRNAKMYLFNPSDPSVKPVVIADRNYQDRYSDPGDFVQMKNQYDEYVLAINEERAFLIGDGYTSEGQFPFIDAFDLKSHQKKRIYQSAYTDKLENIYYSINLEEGEFLVRIESKSEYPNYFIRNIYRPDDLYQITSFENPYKSLEGVYKEVITYKRDDGLDLEGTLYLPSGYDMEKKEKLPMILWAYPREYKDKDSASQSTTNPNRFIYPSWGSPVFWVTQNYAVLERAAFPIVGEGDEEPNDTFRKQLVDNAQAAIHAVSELGYIDTNRVAVGGHSYGAFMVANLLSHSDLFAAGIARSGAYNRTLTPFGFQSEERSYWDSPETYYTMSPFMHADKMKTPLLLIHGEADNNSGTYPMQSERYFNALKGLGAIARLVILPKESHGYWARESILHVLWEQDQWLDKYVKNKRK